MFPSILFSLTQLVMLLSFSCMSHTEILLEDDKKTKHIHRLYVLLYKVSLFISLVFFFICLVSCYNSHSCL